jgi:hypothetical protein
MDHRDYFAQEKRIQIKNGGYMTDSNDELKIISKKSGWPVWCLKLIYGYVSFITGVSRDELLGLPKNKLSIVSAMISEKRAAPCQEKTEKKSCFNCKNALKSPGYSGTYLDPPEPPEAECQNTEVPDYIVELPEPAEKCAWYDPELIAKCSQCGKEMEVPVYLWGIWAYGLTELPCCCRLCQARAQAREDLGFQDQLRDYRPSAN